MAENLSCFIEKRFFLPIPSKEIPSSGGISLLGAEIGDGEILMPPECVVWKMCFTMLGKSVLVRSLSTGLRGLLLVTFVGCVSTEDTKIHGKVIKTASETCLLLTPERILASASLCRGRSSIRFVQGSQIVRYDFKKYEHKLLSTLAQYLRWSFFPLEEISRAKVEFWFSCHWLEADRCQTVAHVKAPSGNFSMHYPVHPDLWTSQPVQILWLGTQSYPAQSPKRVGFLTITAKPEYNAQTMTRFLSETGIMAARTKRQEPLITQLLGHWPEVTLVLEPFAEFKATEILRTHAHATMLVKDVELLPGSDMDGPKAKFHETRFQFKHLPSDLQEDPETPTL